MNTGVRNIGKSLEYTYHLLRGALNKFQKNLHQLNDSQYAQAKLIADKSYALESIVLSTADARDIQIPDSRLDEAMQQVAGRYPDRDSFLTDLQINGLDESILRNSLYRELLFDAVMDRVSARSPQVSDIDIQIFYQLHRERFAKPESRKARHILITINSDYAENNRNAAYERIHVITEKLRNNPARFDALAKKNSECPTAMEGGRLGDVVRGTLYVELDAELFSMEEGAISNVIETELGFHVLFCEKINKSVTVPLARAKPRITQILQARQRKICQKAWLEKMQEESDG